MSTILCEVPFPICNIIANNEVGTSTVNKIIVHVHNIKILKIDLEISDVVKVNF